MINPFLFTYETLWRIERERISRLNLLKILDAHPITLVEYFEDIGKTLNQEFLSKILLAIKGDCLN
tara:strand:+ start:228 stop:425 length:198 start_codon:yes stop_codon:yes gene_type:complete